MKKIQLSSLCVLAALSDASQVSFGKATRE